MPDDRFPAMAYWARVTLTIASALVLLAAAWMVRNILLLVLVAAVLAAGLDPQVRWLQRRRLSRGWAVTIILLLSVGLLVLFAWLVIPSAVRQTQALARHTPDYLNRLQHATGLLGTLQKKYDLAQRLRDTTARIGSGPHFVMETGTPSRAVMFDLLRKRVLVATRDQSPRRIDHDHEMCARARESPRWRSRRSRASPPAPAASSSTC